MLKNKSAQKGSVLILFSIAVIVLVAIGGASYLYLSIQKPWAQHFPPVTHTTLPTPTATSIWKTYISSIYKFSIDYPSNWSLFDTNPYYVRIIKGIHSERENVVDPFFIIYVRENPENLSAYEWITTNYPPIHQNDLRSTKFMNIDAVEGGDEADGFVTFRKEKYVYDLSHNMNSGAIDPDAQKVFTSMLPTFRFIDRSDNAIQPTQTP